MHITHQRVLVHSEQSMQPSAQHASAVEWARQTLAFTADPQQSLVLFNCYRQWAEILRKIKNFSQFLTNTKIRSDGANRLA